MGPFVVLALLAEAVDHVENAEDFGPVADHVPIAGLPPAKQSVAVHDERRAIGDVAILVENAVGADGLPMDVTEQREGQGRALLEGLVTERAVATDGDERRVPLLQFASDLSQAGQLRCSDAAPVVAVETDDDVRLPLVLFERERTSQRGRQRETGRGLTPLERVHAASLPRSDREGNRELYIAVPREPLPASAERSQPHGVRRGPPPPDDLN